MPRKGRARRFREARRLKQGYDDGLFREGQGTLADVTDDGSTPAGSDDLDEHDDLDDDWDHADEDGGDEDDEDDDDWDPDRER